MKPRLRLFSGEHEFLAGLHAFGSQHADAVHAEQRAAADEIEFQHVRARQRAHFDPSAVRPTTSRSTASVPPGAPCSVPSTANTSPLVPLTSETRPALLKRSSPSNAIVVAPSCNATRPDVVEAVVAVTEHAGARAEELARIHDDVVAARQLQEPAHRTGRCDADVRGADAHFVARDLITGPVPLSTVPAMSMRVPSRGRRIDGDGLAEHVRAFGHPDRRAAGSRTGGDGVAGFGACFLLDEQGHVARIGTQADREPVAGRRPRMHATHAREDVAGVVADQQR